MITDFDAGRLRSAVDAQDVTQHELAKKSGVSRTQISRLLRQKRARVRPSTLERLARALKIDATDLCKGGALARFRQWLAEEFGKIDFRGIGMPRLQKLPIEDVFVDVDVREEVAESGDACAGDDRPCHAVDASLGRSSPATECIRTHDRVVVLGNPGCGKTTVLRYLAHCGASGDKGDEALPIYVRLPELLRAREIDERVDLVQFVAARSSDHGCPNVEQPLRETLGDEKRRCLVLLDGLDEVGTEQERERLVDWLQEFIDQYPRNQFVITSRVIGFDSAPWRSQGFAVFRILEYAPRQLQAFAEKWARILSQSEAKPYDEVLDNIGTAIFANPRVRTLASNPLVLTILVLLNEARGGTLPRRRVDLYEKVVDVFLDTWESNKRSAGKFDDTYSIDLDAREFRWLLSDLSLAMQKADRTLAARWWIADRMQEYLQRKLGFAFEEAKDACDRIIRYLAERTGLIEERGLDLFGFSHRSLQEYFASLGVIDEADASRSRDVTQFLREYYFHPQWSEVVRLVAAQLTPLPAESLLVRILDDPDPVGRFLRRGQLLVLQCLSDGTTVANRRLVASVFDTVAELGKSRWLGITLEAIDVLETFEGSRLQEHARNAKESILRIAKNELEKRDYERLHGRVHVREIFEAAESKLPPEFKAEAAREVTITRSGLTSRIVFLNLRLLSKEPKVWYSSVCSLLDDAHQSNQLKKALVRELGRKAVTDPRSRVRVRKILRSEADASVRAACASALGAVTKGRHSGKRLLLQVLAQDPDERVRNACAAALRDAAEDDPSVRDRLLGILNSDEPARVRAGAARGLSKSAVSDPSVSETLQRCLALDREPEDVRISCAWALDPQIGENPAVANTLISWLDAHRSAKLRQVAAQVLATAMADERLPWDRRVVERAESILMNLDRPCPHALESLEELATARETRRGLRLESVLRESLEACRDRIELAFVFGSTARNQQTEDSDIDMLVIGDVNLKALSSPLREAEKTLGRRINPAIYTRRSFQERYQTGDPFLLDVYRREKISVIQREGDTARGSVDDELRTMVAEHVASTE